MKSLLITTHRKYNTMQDFKNDLPDILYDSCKLALQSGDGQKKK